MTALLIRKHVAEFFGTFVLTFGVGLSVIQPLAIPTVVLAGIILGLFVYTVGGISGAHLNPAITVGLFSIRKMAFRDAFTYVLVQLLGGFLAWLLLLRLTGETPLIVADTGSLAALGEGIGTMVFAFGIAAIQHARVPDGATGIVAAGSLIIGAVIASYSALGVLNPAVAVGIRAFSFIYIIVPLIGGIAGMQLYKWLHG